MNFFKNLIACFFLFLPLISCGGGSGGISVLPTEDEFTQFDTINPKMDILWVFDNSVSMQNEVESVVANINAFISVYKDKGYDFRMGVVPTSAWSIEAYHELQNSGVNPTRFYNDNLDALDFLFHPSDDKDTFSRLHTGECTDTNSGHKIIDSNTPDVVVNFEKNLNVFGDLDSSASHCGFNFNGNPSGGTTNGPSHARYVPFTHEYYYGSRTSSHWSGTDRGYMSNFIADERPLQSMRAFLTHGEDKDLLLREDAFLAVILVTDEMDGSSPSLNPCHKAGTGVCPGDKPEHIDGSGNRIFDDPSVYINFLDGLKGTTDLYSMYAIMKPAHASLRAKLGDAAEASGGFWFDEGGSPSDYLNYLNQITGNIVEAATAFPLKCEPDLETLSVVFHEPDGSGDYTRIEVPENEGSGGWTYVAGNQSIKFSEDYFPGSGTRIFIDYTPVVLNCLQN